MFFESLRRRRRKDDDLARVGKPVSHDYGPIYFDVPEIPNPTRRPDGRFAPKDYTWDDYEREYRESKKGKKRRRVV